MSSTFIYYEGDGETRDFVIPFDYLAKRFVYVYINGVELKGGNVDTEGIDYYFAEPTTIRFLTAPEASTLILIKRITSDKERIVNFNDGSILKARDLNASVLQAYHIAAEARDNTSSSLNPDVQLNWDAKYKRIVNLADPVDNNDAVNYRTYITDANGARQSAINAKISENAAKAYSDLADSHMLQAKNSEDNAKVSEDNAKTSEDNAKDSETNAKTSETNSKTSEINAKDSEEKAFEYANHASFAIRSYSDAVTQIGETIPLVKIKPVSYIKANDFIVDNKGDMYIVTSVSETTVTLGQKTNSLKGPQGATGAQGNEGPKGDTGLKGDKGDTGDQGPKGDTGNALYASFKIDIPSGVLSMNYLEEYEGPNFSINNNNGCLEVKINDYN